MSNHLWKAAFGLLTVPILLVAFGLQVVTAGEGTGQRPKIGLALSGGGARGAAHVGALRVLEEMRIPIDFIAGTSMGSIVGGLYASGMSVEEIEQALAEIPWSEIFSDRPPRERRRFRRKQDDYTFLVRHRVGVEESEKELNIAPALIQGQKFDLTLRRYTLPVAKVKDFDEFRIPYRAVAADIVTGEAVVLEEGDLPEAIRASMAVPAVFAPVEIGDKLLVDGGVAMNLPVSVVRDMGADIVIAIDISTPGLSREEIRSALDMLNQLSALLTRRDTEAQIASLRGRDVLIVPELGEEVTSADFKPEKLRRAIAIGEAEARAKQPELERLSLSPQRYAAYRKGITPQPAVMPVVDYVRVENQSRLGDDVIAHHLRAKAGEPLDPGKIEEDISRIYDLDNFESVRYDVEEEDGDTGLAVTAKEKSWGTSSLQFGLDLSSVSSEGSRFNLGAAYTMMPVNELNAEWRTFARLGEEPLLFTEFYQPLDAEEHWFVNLGGGYVSRSIRVFEDLSSDAPSVEYDVDSFGVRLVAGRNLEDWGRLSLAYSLFTGDADVVTGDPGVSDFEFDSGDLELRFDVDTLDNVSFPSKGWRTSAFGLVSRDWLGADTDFEQYGASLLGAGSHGRHRYNALAFFGTTPDDDAPVQNLFRLGGFARLSGFSENQLAGQHAGLLRGTYLYDLQTGLVDTYVGGTLEAGDVWQARDDVDFDDLIFAGSLFLGADTVIGPLYLGYGHAEGGNNGFYLFVGKPWFRF
ncbi:MAG: patatin-like phospholipase family protein [Pseudomonadota bacterium]